MAFQDTRRPVKGLAKESRPRGPGRVRFPGSVPLSQGRDALPLQLLPLFLRLPHAPPLVLPKPHRNSVSGIRHKLQSPASHCLVVSHMPPSFALLPRASQIPQCRLSAAVDGCRLPNRNKGPLWNGSPLWETTWGNTSVHVLMIVGLCASWAFQGSHANPSPPLHEPDHLSPTMLALTADVRSLGALGCWSVKERGRLPPLRTIMLVCLPMRRMLIGKTKSSGGVGWGRGKRGLIL